MVADGAEVFIRYSCNTCHSLDGTVDAGPTLQGLASRQSRKEIVASLRDPNAIIAEGVAPGVMTVMLNANGFQDNVTDTEFDALVDYLQAH